MLGWFIQTQISCLLLVFVSHSFLWVWFSKTAFSRFLSLSSEKQFLAGFSLGFTSGKKKKKQLRLCLSENVYFLIHHSVEYSFFRWTIFFQHSANTILLFSSFYCYYQRVCYWASSLKAQEASCFRATFLGRGHLWRQLYNYIAAISLPTLNFYSKSWI